MPFISMHNDNTGRLCFAICNFQVTFSNFSNNFALVFCFMAIFVFQNNHIHGVGLLVQLWISIVDFVAFSLVP